MFPSLYLITHHFQNKTHLEIIKLAIKGGIRFIQMRDKFLSDKEFFQIALKIRKITIKKKTIFIVNDRLNIALLSNADGIHLGQNDFSIKDTRKLLGKNKIIGITCKTISQAIKAQKEKADYISIGPIFPSSTKPNAGKILGINFIKKIKKYIKIPLYGIGGISLNNLEKCLKSGLNGVAICSDIVQAENITNAAYLINEKIKGIK
ncbi:MAG: thiamine phosphate synthase [bacterium]